MTHTVTKKFPKIDHLTKLVVRAFFISLEVHWLSVYSLPETVPSTKFDHFN